MDKFLISLFSYWGNVSLAEIIHAAPAKGGCSCDRRARSRAVRHEVSLPAPGTAAPTPTPQFGVKREESEMSPTRHAVAYDTQIRA